MNAARVCKLRNDVNKTPQFLLFSMAKRGTKTNSALVNCRGIEFLIGAFMIVNCGMKKKDLINVHNEYSLQLSKLLYNWQLKNKEAL